MVGFGHMRRGNGAAMPNMTVAAWIARTKNGTLRFFRLQTVHRLTPLPDNRRTLRLQAAMRERPVREPLADCKLDRIEPTISFREA